jgi:hypothetical protein
MSKPDLQSVHIGGWECLTRKGSWDVTFIHLVSKRLICLRFGADLMRKNFCCMPVCGITSTSQLWQSLDRKAFVQPVPDWLTCLQFYANLVKQGKNFMPVFGITSTGHLWQNPVSKAHILEICRANFVGCPWNALSYILFLGGLFACSFMHTLWVTKASCQSLA